MSTDNNQKSKTVEKNNNINPTEQKTKPNEIKKSLSE